MNLKQETLHINAFLFNVFLKFTNVWCKLYFLVIYMAILGLFDILQEEHQNRT